MNGIGRWASGAAAILAVGSGVGWAQHGGHGGHGGHETMSMPGSREDGEMAERRSRMEKLERLGEKIEKLEAELEKPDISSKRREKLKKKLDKLFAKRDRLLPDGGSPPVLSPGGGMPSGGAVFTCPMGHDAGVATKDGRCPRCGMALERARSHGASGGYEAPRSSGTACGGRADAGSDACRTP